MLTANGVKILDFGLAKMLNRDSRSTGDLSVSAAGAIAGTLQYMAPEQLEGKQVDERADIYAFGAVLYEMLSGRRAFEGETQAALISAIMAKQPPPLHRVEPSLPSALEHVIENCLAKDIEARWQTAADVLLELKWLSEGGTYDATSGRKRTAIIGSYSSGQPLRSVVAVLSFLGGRFGDDKGRERGGSSGPVGNSVPEEVAMSRLIPSRLARRP